MKRKPLELTPTQYTYIKQFLPSVKRTKPRKYSYRSILVALFYIAKTGIQWRLLPPCYPHWKSVYYYYSLWKKDKVFKMMLLKCSNTNPDRVGIIDSQSIKTDRSFIRGRDGYKKVNGVKKFKVVDMKSQTILNYITPAHINDKKGVKYIIQKFAWRDWFTIKTLYADKGFESSSVQREAATLYNIDFKAMKTYHDTTKYNIWNVVKKHTVKRYNASISKIRWHVEQAFAWENGYRRLSKDYEYLLDSYEAFVDIVNIYMRVKRI